MSTSEQCRRNLEVLFNNTTIVPFKHRGKHLCFFCNTQVDNRDQLIIHNLTHLPCNASDMKEVKYSKFSDVKIDVSEISCKICSEHFRTLDEVAFHLTRKHKLVYSFVPLPELSMYRLKDHKCLLCDQIQTDYNNLLRHVATEHATTLSFQCDHCGQKYNGKKSLRAHIMRFHMESYMCRICSETFGTWSEMVKHKEYKHISKCIICLKAYPTCNAMTEHIKTDHEINEGSCVSCQKYFETKNEFLEHAVKCSSSLRENAKQKNIMRFEKVRSLRENIAYILNNSSAVPFKCFNNKFRCFYCSKNFDKCADLKIHTNEQHPICDVTLKCMKMKHRSRGDKIKIDSVSLRCEICPEPMDDLDALVAHFKSTHKVSVSDCIDQLMPFKLVQDHYPCPFCSEEYTYFNALLGHVNLAHNGNTFICMHCGQPFRTDQTLRTHVAKKHPKLLPFECDKCNFATSLSSALQDHMGSAHGAKIVKCQHCEERFTSRYARNVHNIRVHGGGHKCEHCGKVYTKYSHVVNHVRKNHLLEKNVRCTLCDKTFFDTSRLTRHMVVHGDRDKNYKCNHCGKGFLRKGNLSEHMKSHLNISKSKRASK